MKKILHLTHTHIESDSRILKEMGALATAGYAVSGIGVQRAEGAKSSTLAFEAHIANANLLSRKLTSLPRTLRHAFSLLELIVKVVPRAVAKRPDVIHCHDTLMLPLGALVKMLTRARLIYDAHELESDRNGLTPMQGKLTLMVEKFLWRFVDALIVVSPSIDTWYQTTVGPKRSCVILNSPLLKENSVHDNNYLRRKFAISSERKIFIYVGILGAGRGIDLILDVFKDPEMSSHVVFLGYGPLRDELKRMSEVHSNIHVHESVPHAEVVPVVRSADFGFCLVQNVSLSDYYCLPNKLFEYCFAGVPVVASDFPDIRAVLSEYAVGVTCDLSSSDIKKSIRKLEESKTTFSFNDLGPLSWQTQEKKLINLYRKVLDNSRN